MEAIDNCLTISVCQNVAEQNIAIILNVHTYGLRYLMPIVICYQGKGEVLRETENVRFLFTLLLKTFTHSHFSKRRLAETYDL